MGKYIAIAVCTIQMFFTHACISICITGPLSQLTYQGKRGVGGRGNYPICTGEPPVTIIKLSVYSTLIKLPVLICITHNAIPSSTYILWGCMWGATKVHMFAWWTTMVPPRELSGPWDQGVSIINGPRGHLRREGNATHNTQNIKLLIHGTSIWLLSTTIASSTSIIIVNKLMFYHLKTRHYIS